MLLFFLGCPQRWSRRKASCRSRKATIQVQVLFFSLSKSVCSPVSINTLMTPSPPSVAPPPQPNRVLELQESPCLNGSGIVIAVEGPCSASLLTQHGPLPGRSYICLVRPRRCEVGCAKDRGGVEIEGGGSVGTFDAAYYWHGVGETPAVEEVSSNCVDYGSRGGGGGRTRTEWAPSRCRG